MSQEESFPSLRLTIILSIIILVIAIPFVTFECARVRYYTVEGWVLDKKWDGDETGIIFFGDGKKVWQENIYYYDYRKLEKGHWYKVRLRDSFSEPDKIVTYEEIQKGVTP